MSDAALPGLTGTWSERRAGGSGTVAATTWQLPDARRALQLALAATWLLDGVLQMQPYMFSKSFGRLMLASMAARNPGTVAHSILWAAREIGAHAAAANAVFCVVQIAIGLGIAARPTVRVALAVSIIWSAGVWWFGEGLGGLLTGTASPVSGAPGAVMLYAVLAVLLWPSGRRSSESFVAARMIGARAARLVWLVLWVGLSGLTLQSANRTPDALSNMINGMAAGEPRWLTAVDAHVASALVGRGLAASIMLAVLLALVGVGIFTPPRWARAVVASAIVIALAIWVVGEAFGGIFSGSGTDPNSGPLLVLLALAFWPAVRSPAALGGAEPERQPATVGE
ncbi:MAG: hypothetical protein ACLQK4_08935 [Acidimicrobiales bacterium]